MPSFVDIYPGKTPAESTDVQQLIDTFTSRRNTPIAITTNDPINYTVQLKNTDPAARGMIIYGADGVTVLFQADATGVKVSRAGAAAQAPLTEVGPAAGQAAEGNHTHGAGGYSGTGTVTLETLYSGTWVTTGTNLSVAAATLYVFCTTGVTVTLPAANATNRPITVISIAGSQTVNAAGGSVLGGSVNPTTGAVMNGIVSAGDALTWKSDGTNWRAV